MVLMILAVDGYGTTHGATSNLQSLSDARAGSINGKVALLASPAGEVTRGCEVHLVNAADETIERVYPCRTWFQPPVGRYLFWLEQGTSVSYQSIIYYAGEPFTSAGKAFVKELYPAGTVHVAKANVRKAATLRLLALDTRGSYRPFDRKIAVGNLDKPVRLPAGRMVGGIFDSDGKALSLSRPVALHAGQSVTVRLGEPDSKRSVVLAVFNRWLPRKPLPLCTGELVTDRDSIRPDIDMQAYDRVVLIWYRVGDRGVANVDVRCQGRDVFRKPVLLARGSISTIRTELMTVSTRKQHR